MHVALPKSRASDKLPLSEQRLGFLAASRDPSLGYVGGYLLTTARGRPIEFHYTTPVNPSPTHKILYGAELEPYILAELIGSNLVRQCSIEPAFIITDQAHILSQRKNWACPIIHVTTRSAGDGAGLGVAEPAKPELSGHPDNPDDVAALRHWLDEVNPGLNLDEPFVRVWEAIREVLAAAAPKTQAA